MTRFHMLSVTLLLFFSVILVHAELLSNIIPKLTLSPNARIHLRNSPNYASLIKRWQYWQAPDFSAVIDIATESDVSASIRFANAHHIPFLAQSGGHGGTSALGALQDGIQLRLRQLNSVRISKDGTYATVGGGIKGVELRDYLWSHGKWTVTGMCECPGHVAVALGGGIGILQGRYGLASDQVLGMNVVLANGTAVRVSEIEHTELFWAMRGAGHNFGVVTSMDVRIYDVSTDEGRVWSHEILTYEATAANVREVFAVGKNMLESNSQPDGMMVMGVITSSPELRGKMVIMLHVVNNSPLANLQNLTQPYHVLSPLSTDSHEGTYLDIPRWFEVHDTSIACNPSQVMSNPAYLRFPVNSRTYDIDALVAVVDEFAKFVDTNPDFSGSTIMIEQWPGRAVLEQAGNGAVPWREHLVLIAPALLYSRDPTGSRLDDVAWAAGRMMQKILVDGAERTGGHYAYVNYASGGEDVDEIYKQENVGKLRNLKGVYDPEDRFRYYAPLGVWKTRQEKDEL